jgi:hypothetical protein
MDPMSLFGSFDDIDTFEKLASTVTPLWFCGSYFWFSLSAILGQGI